MRIYGHDVPVRAAIVEMSGLSGHAGHNELFRWLSPLRRRGRCFITHGELPAATALAGELRTTKGWNTVVPKLGEGFLLEG